MHRWTDRSLVLVLWMALAVPVWAGDGKASPAAATPAAMVDELLTLLEAGDHERFVERMTPPDSPERARPTWAEDVRETAKAYASATPAEREEMLDTFRAMAGTAWTIGPDGRTASLRTGTGADGTGTPVEVTAVLVGGTWYPTIR